MLSDSKVCTLDSAKAKALGKHFDSIFTTEKMDQMPQLPASPYSDIPEIKFTMPGVSSKLLDLIRLAAQNSSLLISLRKLRSSLLLYSQAFISNHMIWDQYHQHGRMQVTYLLYSRKEYAWTLPTIGWCHSRRLYAKSWNM